MSEIFDFVSEMSGRNAPRVQPSRYPGWWPSKSFTLGDLDAVDMMQLAKPTLGFDTFGVEASGNPTHYNLGHAEVRDFHSGKLSGSLSNFLQSHGLEPLEERIPVLAVGSNASPAQLVHKFSSTGVSPIIPSFRCRIQGKAVGFVPSISPLGYVPATLVTGSQSESAEIFIQFMSRVQVEVIDRSEGVAEHETLDSYERVWVESDIQLDLGPKLTGAFAYIARCGYLSLNEKPVLMENMFFGIEEAAAGKALEIHKALASADAPPSQQDLYRLLGRYDKVLQGLLETFCNLNARDRQNSPDIMAEINERLSRFSAPNRLLDLAPEPKIREHFSYGDSLAQSSRAEIVSSSMKSSELTLSVLPTSNKVLRSGESVAVVGRQAHEALGKPKHLLIKSDLVDSVLSSASAQSFSAPVAIAKVLVAEDWPEDKIAVDEVLRVATGAQVGELVLVKGASKAKNRNLVNSFSRLALGAPNVVTLRVVPADMDTMERDVALISPLAIQMLGIDPGDFVILEGAEFGSGRVRQTSVRAFPIDSETSESRIGKIRGGWLAAYPDPKVGLGISEDLGMVFIDSATRERLFGPGHKQRLGSVRLRASRVEQVQKESREFALILIFAALAWILSASEDSIFTLAPGKALALAAIMLFALFLTLRRIRWRYIHTRRSR